ncbi:PREDICTED: pyridoxine/pyridoxamine 5'-phosphate oxidase 2 isoform X2 [Populus euphratica]|uniref:pyridoxal 5'-phosphate synthase n=1 Tax=Populus euphratica TaxID=75702 RepID=A0AAJ6Y0Y4_POPEU|nr:PREDICTED: pyridoxine/pyridoxamine 5'-phosphate oxidase 2 isoform X2 [Populus euphratica]
MGTVTQWKQLLLSALESNSHLKHSPYFQFATIGCNGRPSNRSVVFRGFEENSDRIQINTDFRTRKICWYFSDSWEQFRISGRVDVIDGSSPDPEKLQQREKSWFASSLKSRLQYLGPNPGLPCLSEQSLNEFFLDPSSGPVATFCLLVLDPDQVDYLNLKSNQRTVSTLSRCANGEMCWNSEMINP